MVSTIKPIETVYNGYCFRSRLEARWAVFFDTLGIKYEYEKEGFDLGFAGKYLPDFFLPFLAGGAWLEIKAMEYDVSVYDKNRWDVFAAQLAEGAYDICHSQMLLVVFGDPFDSLSLWIPAGGWKQKIRCLWGVGRSLDRIEVSLCADLSAADKHFYLIRRKLAYTVRKEHLNQLTHSKLLTKARFAARQARFEHEYKQKRA